MKKPIKIILNVEGGVVHSHVIPDGVIVEIRDHDIEGLEGPLEQKKGVFYKKIILTREND